MMHITVRSAKVLWFQRTTDFPYTCVRPIGNPQPDDPMVQFLILGPYLVCPIGGQAYWGFARQDDLDHFQLEFGDTDGQP